MMHSILIICFSDKNAFTRLEVKYLWYARGAKFSKAKAEKQNRAWQCYIYYFSIFQLELVHQLFCVRAKVQITVYG